jgi:hypothetical protein
LAGAGKQEGVDIAINPYLCSPIDGL